MAAGVPDANSDVRTWANFCRASRDLFGTEEETALMKKLSTSDTSNNKEKQRILLAFLLALKGNEKFKGLAEETVVAGSGVRTFRIFELMAGFKDSNKKALLNTCLILFSHTCIKQSHRRKPFLEMTPKEQALAEYEANVIARIHRQLFKILGDNGVPYKQSDFRNMSGSYDEVWKKRINNAIKYRPDYATLPNQAAAELDDSEKIDAAVAAGKLDPFNNYHHNLILCLYLFMRDVDMRAGEEVSKNKNQDISSKIFVAIRSTHHFFISPLFQAG